MKNLRLFQIDAFADQVFRGNPAAVCPLRAWLDDAILQAIAQENNLAETAFFVANGDSFELRWFTPRCEVGLCGHAALAAAFVLFREMGFARESIRFDSRSGPLDVRLDRDLLSMDFPSLPTIACPDPPASLLEGLGTTPKEVLYVTSDTNYFAIYGSEQDVRAIRPNLSRLEQLHPYGIAVSSPGERSDCASRYFAPGYGIPEDTVTGSIHCALVPYWAKQLNKTKIHARQVSERGGQLFCEFVKDRVRISGYAVQYLEGLIHL
jgi:PhzF family phenazine biosynthesis protein